MNDFTSIEKRVQRLTAEELDMDVMEMVCELKSLVCTLSHMLMTQSNQLAGLQAQLNTYMYGTPHHEEDMSKSYPKKTTIMPCGSILKHAKRKTRSLRSIAKRTNENNSVQDLQTSSDGL